MPDEIRLLVRKPESSRHFRNASGKEVLLHKISLAQTVRPSGIYFMPAQAFVIRGEFLVRWPDFPWCHDVTHQLQFIFDRVRRQSIIVRL